MLAARLCLWPAPWHSHPSPTKSSPRDPVVPDQVGAEWRGPATRREHPTQPEAATMPTLAELKPYILIIFNSRTASVHGEDCPLILPLNGLSSQGQEAEPARGLPHRVTCKEGCLMCLRSRDSVVLELVTHITLLHWPMDWSFGWRCCLTSDSLSQNSTGAAMLLYNIRQDLNGLKGSMGSTPGVPVPTNQNNPISFWFAGPTPSWL